jgi:succinyl-CoA synthetase alpha subunit
MAILVGKNTRAVVQGITGSQGVFHTKLMMEYGTKIVAGVTPGKGGTNVHGIPVYDTVSEAMETHKATASIIFVPAPSAKEAAFEAIDAGLNPVIMITEGIPVRDTMEIVAVTREKKTSLIGPNTPGIITPGECKLGIMPGQVFGKGDVGLMSRSGTLTYEIAAGLTKSGVGETTCVGIGGDPIVGLTFIELLEIFREDKDTKAVALIGEIGGNAEEQAAEYIKKTSYPKPVAAYIAGRTAPPGKRMGHAGAIISGKTGTADSKIEALRSAGVSVAEKPTDVARLLANLIGK